MTSSLDSAFAALDPLLGISAKTAQDLTTPQVCVRAVLVYVILIAYVRFGKKRFLGQATAFDAILVIIIGSVASRAISGTAPFVASLAGTFVLIAMHWAISFFTEGSPTLGELIKGRDTLLIRNGGINRRGLKKSHISPDDLEEDLRQQGVDNPKKVKEARLERSGRVSVITPPTNFSGRGTTATTCFSDLYQHNFSIEESVRMLLSAADSFVFRQA